MSGGPQWGASFAAASTNAMSFYDDIMVPRLFEPWAHVLLDEVEPQSGHAVLDVACGPGTVTRLAARRVGPSGTVTGCDLSPAMLELARAKPVDNDSAPIDYLQCAADALAVTDQDFDVVTCQQGLQFFPNRPAALAEMRRALRAGGQLGISVWCDIEQCPPFAAVEAALRQVLGEETAHAFRGGPWGFGDAHVLANLVSEGGFTNLTVERHEKPIVFEGGPEQLLQTIHATAVAATFAALSEAELAEFATAVASAARPFTVDGVIRSHTASNIVTATVSGDRV